MVGILVTIVIVTLLVLLGGGAFSSPSKHGNSERLIEKPAQVEEQVRELSDERTERLRDQLDQLSE